MNIRRHLVLPATLVAAAAVAFAATGSAATTTATPATRTAFSSQSAVTPLSYSCASTGVPTAAMVVRRVANYSYRFDIYVGGVLKRTGAVKASPYGWITGRQVISNNKTQSVQLRLNNQVVVNGYLTPRCTVQNPWGPSYVVNTSARGSSASYALHKNANGTVTRWNPCDGAIRVRVNPTNGGTGALQDAVQAISALAQATGLKFTYDGTTTFVPRSGNTSSQPAHIVIAWAGRTQTDLLGAGAIGEGGWHSVGSSLDGYRWTWKINSGFVVLDPAAHVSGGFGRGSSRGALLLHELGHAAGLGHTGDSLQVMYPSLGSTSYASWGSGDRSGLTQVGASKGCVPTA